MDPDLPSDEESLKGTRDWPHAPPHRLVEGGTFFLTVRCVEERHHFATPERRDFLQESLLNLATYYEWKMEAWAVLSNHYHFVAHSPNKPDSLSKFLRHVHGDTARYVNRLDGRAGRQVWHNFRETHLTYQNSYLARLNYTHQNAVHHRIVPVANQWRWCSAAKFEQSVTPAWCKTVYGFKFDQIDEEDGENDGAM
jgi:putative transposase